jgi:hypothetical protein
MPEMRKHKRYKAPEGSIALADGNMARIIDISRGGISILFLDNSLLDIPKTLCLDLLSAENKTKVHQIPGEVAWEQEISFSTISGFIYKKVGMRFGGFTLQQKGQLELFLLDYTDGRGLDVLLSEDGEFDGSNHGIRGEG